MRIAIDASRATITHVTGTEHYARELIRHVILLNDQRPNPHTIWLYFRDQPTEGLFPVSKNVTYRVIPFPRLWTHLRFAYAIWQDKPDVTFVPAHTLPLWLSGKAVVTVHDLGYKLFPEAHPANQVRYLDWSTRHSASRADCILADSQATSDDLQKFYCVPGKKIQVVYPGVNKPAESIDFHLYQKYQIPNRYFLFIGTLQPRKNIQRIVQAYQMWRQANQDKEIGLVLAGKKGWLFDEAWIQGVDGVTVTGYIDEADKAGILRQAMALIFPSLYEGFGFPVLEAMHARTPVIASNTSSLPELVGDAGILVDPLSIHEIASALDLISAHDHLREQLVMKGLEQAKHFTWEQAAENTLNALDAVMNSES